MRAQAEAEDIVRGVVKHDEELIRSIVRSFYDLYVRTGRDCIDFIREAESGAGLSRYTAARLFIVLSLYEREAAEG